MNNSVTNKNGIENERLDVNHDENRNKFQSEIKNNNRIHRIDQNSSHDSNFSHSDRKSNIESYKKNNSLSQKKKSLTGGINSVEKEIKKRKNIYKEFLLLYSEMKNNRLLEEESLNDNNNFLGNINQEYKSQNIIYYIINKTWFNQFKNYCSKKEIECSNINEDYPGQINNQHLILKDDNCLKLLSENRIIINSEYLDNCAYISEDMWNFLIKICGGGPEIKFISNTNNSSSFDINNNNDEIDVIRKCVHINLLFICKKEVISKNNNKEPSLNINNSLNPFQSLDIKKILVNNELKNKIHIQYIYFDITKNVQELTNYINKILNQHRNKFINTPIYFGPNNNSERNNCLVEDINYRLWLNDIIINPNELANFLIDQINKFEDEDFLMSFTQMDNINDCFFHPYLLSHFINYKIMDIFPNKYTKNFNNSDYYETKFEDENTIPTITILVEEFPYHFENPKKTFFIKKCNYCHYRDYVYSGCICNKVFYCNENCRKKDFSNHMITCKKGLFDSMKKKNENLSKIIFDRKVNYEKNKNEEKNFPILGLSNLGNSCYMNASLQCFFAIKELTNYFFNYFKEDQLNKDNILGTRGVLTIAYINLLLNINNTTNNKYFSPETFKIILGLCSKKYEGNEQEDAHEFITYLLDMMHEDLNRVINKPNINENEKNTKNINISENEKSILDWNNFLKRNQSVIIDIFYGQYKSCVLCPLCNFKSISFNSFSSLELPISESRIFMPIIIYFVDIFKDSPMLIFTIYLLKDEFKIYFLRKKISIFLNIDILEFELVLEKYNEIIHIFENNEDIPSNLKFIYAYRINPKYFYSEKNLRIKDINNKIKRESQNINLNEYANKKYKINFDDLENNIKKRKKDIELYENKSIKNDLYYLNSKFNNSIGLDDSFFQRVIIQNHIIKNKNIKNFDTDDIIYLQKNKKCNEIYFEIFTKYAVNIISNNLDINFANNFFQIYNSNDTENLNIIMMKIYLHYFQNVKLHPSTIDLINNFPDCPFVLFLHNKKYNITDLIPLSSYINYNDVLTKFYNKINSFKNINLDEYYSDNDELEIDNKNNLKNDIISNKNITCKGLPGGESGDYQGDNNFIESEEESDSESDDDKNNDNDNDKYNENDNENEGIYYRTEKDENIDRIIIIWNRKYIKHFLRNPDINLNDISKEIYENSLKKRISIEKFFDEFSKEEKLDKDNLWKCPKCNKNSQASKKIELYNMPKVLIIHLKRFNNNKKINTFIDFPLTNLDISKYINKKRNTNDTHGLKYDLFGVINHYGSMDYGHYTSFCKNMHDNKWYEYNDRIVNEIQPGKEYETIVNPNAYILFYREQNCDMIKWDNIYNKKYEEINENNLKKFGQDFIYEKNPNEDKIQLIEDEIDVKDKIIQKLDIDLKADESENRKISEDKGGVNSIMENNEDNFSFKEGYNNFIDINDNSSNSSEVQTPKFKSIIKANKENRIKEKNFSFKINHNEKDILNNEHNNTSLNEKSQANFKEKNLKNENTNFSSLNKNFIKSDNNTIKIKTFKKNEKNKNKNIVSDKKNKKNKKSKDTKKNTKNNIFIGFIQNENMSVNIENYYTNNELLKYDLFHLSKNNITKPKKQYKNIKSKKLAYFLLKEYCDDITDKIPRKKKLYKDSNLKIEANINNNSIIDKQDENKAKEVKITVKEDNQNLKYVNKNDINLNDFVYNPFKDYFAKLRKFGK